MVPGRPRGRPSKTSYTVSERAPLKSPPNDGSPNANKRLVSEDSNIQDTSDLPALEMRIYHSGSAHGPQTLNDKVVYKYRNGREEPQLLDTEKIEELGSVEEERDDFFYEDKEMTVSVKKALIDDYRKKSNYWGPLRIIGETVKVKENRVLKDAIQAKLQHVEIQATDNEGKPVNEHELKILMSQTPGIIPACDPPSEFQEDKGYFILQFGPDEKYKVLKKAMNAFKKLSGAEPPFNTKIQKVFTTSNEGKVTPLTVVSLCPRVSKVVYQSKLITDNDHSLKQTMKKKSNDKQLVNFYRQNYITWAHRGNICFSEIKKAGIDFFDEILVGNSSVDESLKTFGKGLSSSATIMEETETPDAPLPEESTHPVGSEEFVEELWLYLATQVRADSLLIEFEFEMDEEKWFEVKRAFNMFQINGEVLPDITLKIASRKIDEEYSLNYYLRSLGRLVKWGPIISKADINCLLKCLGKDRYVCIGLDKEDFLWQVDQNEMLRLHLKENSHVFMSPFESLHDNKCKAIIRETDNIKNGKISRGKASLYGPLVTCQPCEDLLSRIKEIQDPNLTRSIPLESTHRIVRQRYGPIVSTNISQSIKNLFTLTPQEFISSKRKTSIDSDGQSLPKCMRTVDPNLDMPKDKPHIEVTEAEFEKMITIKKCSSSFKRVCEECGFKAKTMLSLFTHMTDHLGPLVEKCTSCTVKVSSSEALKRHIRQCHSIKSCKCSLCSKSFNSKAKLYDHMNKHRTSKPYNCSSCWEKFQSFNCYKKHLTVTHNVTSVKHLNLFCRVCNSYFITAAHLLIHKVNRNHIDKEHIKCIICNFSCNLVSAFVKHIRSHSDEERESNNLAICSECQKMFFSSFSLEDHMRMKHQIVTTEKVVIAPTPPVVETPAVTTYEGFSCGKCYKVFTTVNNLQRHIEVSHPEKVVTEAQVQPATIPNSRPTAITTSRPTTTASAANSFSCTMCGRKFTSEHFLSTHMKLHTANRPVFQCEECGYVYSKRTQVLEHIRNDHAEQVEKHQQMQQQQQHSILPDNAASSQNPNAATVPIFGAQQTTYPTSQVIGIQNHAHMIQPPQTWGNQLKVPSVEQPPEVTYNFPNFNAQFF